MPARLPRALHAIRRSVSPGRLGLGAGRPLGSCWVRLPSCGFVSVRVDALMGTARPGHPDGRSQANRTSSLVTPNRQSVGADVGGPTARLRPRGRLRGARSTPLPGATPHPPGRILSQVLADLAFVHGVAGNVAMRTQVRSGEEHLDVHAELPRGRTAIVTSTSAHSRC